MRTGWRVYGFFAVFVLLNIAANYVHAVTPAFFQELVLPDYMFGVALALMYLTMFAFSPFWGQMSGVLSSRVCMLITTWGYALSQIVFCTAKGTTGVAVGRLLAGSFAGGIAGGGYGGINWGILSAPNAPMLNVINCLCTGSVRASDTAGGIVGYETSLQVWDNGIGYLQSNLFAGTIETAGGTQVGAITGAFRGLDRYDIIQDNYYGEGCGAARGIGGVEYVDTSCETHETEIGVNYFDTSKEVPIFEGVNDIFKGNLRADHNRTDDPLGADAETLAKRINRLEMPA